MILIVGWLILKIVSISKMVILNYYHYFCNKRKSFLRKMIIDDPIKSFMKVCMDDLNDRKIKKFKPLKIQFFLFLFNHLNGNKFLFLLTFKILYLFVIINQNSLGLIFVGQLLVKQ